MGNGAWSTVHGEWCMVNSAWGMVHSEWCMVSGAWRVVKKKFVTLITAPMVLINAYSQERQTGVHSYILCSSIQKTE